MEFWCPVCKATRAVPSLQVASSDGHTLFTVCEEHFPDEDKRDVTVMVESHPNADGVVRTITFEDLLKKIAEPPKPEEPPKN